MDTKYGDPPLGPTGRLIPKLQKTGSWRTFRPILDNSKCTKCGICIVFCPDNSIKRNEKDNIEINYDLCKGCGICMNECPIKAISLIVEKSK